MNRLRTLAAAVLASGFAAAGLRAGELRPPLPEILARAAPDERIPVSIVLARQVPRGEVARIAASIRDRAARRRAIVGRLREEARLAQEPLLGFLAPAVAAGRAGGLRPLWISSIVGAELTPDLLRQVAARSDVDHVNYNPKREVFLGPGASFDRGAPSPSFGPGAGETECGVALMRAPEVWNDLGVTGGGAAVAVIDTGVCYTHPDIANQIWVNPGEDLDADGAVMDPDDENGVDDDGNGFVDDLIGWNFDLGNNDPGDGDGHGSHVAGTVAGDGTSGTRSGMAPDAKIMVLRVGVSFSDEVDVWSAMQYAADNGANAISMSLGWPHSQNPDRSTWRNNCENTIDIGTAMVIAAGNEGSGNEPDNVRTPGDVPRVISVGATDCSDQIAGFSSRGPVTWQDVPPWNDHPYPPGLVKPDVSAPGVDTVSHYFCSGYTLLSGTSMATPHVAGTVALMAAADPGLTHDEIKQVLQDTSVDLGPPGNDNAYGRGRVDAYEAVAFVAGQLVYDSHATADADPSYGNGDGNVDVEEITRLTITLRNKGTTAATNVWAILSTDEPAIEVLDSVASFPDIPAGALAASQSPHFTFRLTGGCGQNVTFRLEVRHDDGSVSFTRFSLRTGEYQERVFFDDDMEIDNGWTASGPETNGRFVREDPYRVVAGSTEIQPDDDATADPGVRCWVTGNPRPRGNFDPDEGDVDSEAILDSPLIDASGAEGLTLDLTRWFYMDPPTLFESSHYELLLSNDGGATFVVLEALYGAAASWVPRSLPVSVAPTAQMRIRVRVLEARPAGFGNNLIEALIDDVGLSGFGYFCDAFTEPAVQPPHPVGDTLRLGKTADSLRLDWEVPPTDATHDAATSYRIHRSASPSAGFALHHTTTANFRVEDRELTRSESWYYLVVSANGGGTSGEDP
jgi:serine protease AprX